MEVSQHKVEKLFRPKARIVDKGCCRILRTEPLHKDIENGRFAGPYIPRKQNEALAVVYAIRQRRQRFFDHTGGIKELRIWTYAERRGLQLEVFLIHGSAVPPFLL